MKAVLLAGGLGTRLGEETWLRPKPMLEIGGKPILWHIMKIYSAHGINEFIICAGYKGYVIKEYFANYFLHSSDITFDLSCNSIEVHNHKCEQWKVTIVDTGENTMTGGRVKRVRPYLNGETFLLTYGDGVADIDITETIAFHRKKRKLATVTAVRTPGRFGLLNLDTDHVKGFEEKPHGESGWINGGFFVVEPEALDYIDGDSTMWEREPMENLVGANQLAAYKHHGFWQCMDTLRDKTRLEELWNSGKAPWMVWE